MNFLPEEDQEYLRNKGCGYHLVAEVGVDGKIVGRALLFASFSVPGNLRVQTDSGLVVCQNCELMILIPPGYSATKLDSFYTRPHLKRTDGSDPQNANVEQLLFGRPWQFWSRHIADTDWRAGVDGIGTYLNYIVNELRSC
jgi:hypothetical protein